MAVKKTQIQFTTRGTKKTERDISNVDKSLQRSTTSALRLAGAFAGALGVTAALRGVTSEIIKTQNAQAKLNSVIKSTGGIAGVTSKQVETLAEELSRLTTFSKSTTIEAGALLLTFTKIGEEVFPLALKTAQDMAAFMGGDMKSVILQLGKALNDPIRGVGALAEVGVSFTQSQRDLIRSLVESNRFLEAQKIILAELQVEFGVAAIALGKTFGGQLIILRNRLLAALGDESISVVNNFTEVLKIINENFIPLFETVVSVTKALVSLFIAFRAAAFVTSLTLFALNPVVGTLFAITSAVTAVILAFKGLNIVFERNKRRAKESAEANAILRGSLVKLFSTLSSQQIVMDINAINTELAFLEKNFKGGFTEKVNALIRRRADLVAVLQQRTSDLFRIKRPDSAPSVIPLIDTSEEEALAAKKLAIEERFRNERARLIEGDFVAQRLLLDDDLKEFREFVTDKVKIDEFAAAAREQIRFNESAARHEANASLLSGLSSLSGEIKVFALTSVRLAQASAIADTFAGANKAFAQGGAFAFITAAGVIAQGLANVAQIENQIGKIASFAGGGSFVTQGPEVILVGDNPGGREQVDVTPVSSPNVGGPSSNITLQFNGPVTSTAFIVDELIPAFKTARRRGLLD